MKMPSTSHLLAFGLSVLAGPSPAYADIAGRPEVVSFIQDMAGHRHLDAAELTKLFGQVDIQKKIIDAMDRPAESKPWWEYRKILLTEAHIQGGAEFWKRNRAALEEASNRYGVAPEMIVAIIGAESRYGEFLGSYRVIDALSTLAFGYPRRAEYFRKELEEYLLLCKEDDINPLQPHGSYAGAMGMPQFMPSSYRQYAADGDGDKKRNIWSNPADAVASVANYFAHSGWHKAEPVAFPVTLAGEFHGQPDRSVKLEHSLDELRGQGLVFADALPGATQVSLLMLDQQTGPEYWLALHNFQVITRYNHSPLYAMATYQLGKEILARRPEP